MKPQVPINVIAAPLIYPTERKIRARSHQYFHFPERGCSEPVLTHLLTRSDLSPVGDSCLPTWLLFRLLNRLGESVSLNVCVCVKEREKDYRMMYETPHRLKIILTNTTLPSEAPVN